MNYNKSWEFFIKESIYLEDMKRFVENSKDICPTKENVFRFLNSNFNDIKCIILGMDPYPSTYNKNDKIFPVATGRAFEVANIDYFTDKYKQVSLANIFKALFVYKIEIDGKSSISGTKQTNVKGLEKLANPTMDDLRFYFKDVDKEELNIHKWFDNMERQGVLFLNSTLTTKIGKAGAHINIWKDFMDELIKYINKHLNCHWLIWGDKALNRVKDIVNDKNIIYSCHPASRVNNNFVEDCCFKKVKEITWF